MRTDSVVRAEVLPTRGGLWVVLRDCYSSAAASTCSTTPSSTVCAIEHFNPSASRRLMISHS